ncbi:MAG: glycosyltransferase [Bacillota bacterium]
MSAKILSVIIPTYNAADSILTAINSVISCSQSDKFEIIVVDDCSSDNSFEIVQSLAQTHKNIISLKMDKNSGSPSMPRNKGIEIATGDYIFFLDDDDFLEPEKFVYALEYAIENDLDFLKGYLKVINNSGLTDANRMIFEKGKVFEQFISSTSTNMSVFLKREFVINHNIRFNPKYKLGEDTLLTCQIFSCLPKAEYIDDYYCFYNNKLNENNLSSTQNYGDKELNDHLEVWELAEKELNKIGLSYFELRLPIALKNSIVSIVSFSKGQISKEVFLKLSIFANKQSKQIIGKTNLHKRFQEVQDTIFAGIYEDFMEVTKRRLLINGHDLKFILPVVDYLKAEFSIKIDEWSNHNLRVNPNSQKLVGWADIIFCEWMMGNAVWYSKNKLSFQKLIIRAHRFEIGREFGEDIQMHNVDAVIAVSYYYLEKFASRFNIPREKMRLISNYVDSKLYTKKIGEGSKFKICIAGIIPARKGFLRGLELLKALRESNKDFELVILGANPKDQDWTIKNPTEKEYYEKCNDYIKKYDLGDSVLFRGWVAREEMFKDIGFVLSLSDELQPESFHLAPAEALVDNTAALILEWQGVEYIYPETMVYESLDKIKDEILQLCSKEKLYNDYVESHKKYILENYSVDEFLIQMKRKVI